MDYEATKRMEDFAKEILRQTPAMQKKMWEALKPVLTADEIHGLGIFVGIIARSIFGIPSDSFEPTIQSLA